ncbi:MAG: hypothetical protein AB1791_23665, partial [Chloroflexota bacterium]
LGFCTMALGATDKATEFFEKGLTMPTMFMWLMRPRLLCGLALVALSQNRLEEAQQKVAEARAFAEERAMQNIYPLVSMTDAQVVAHAGDLEASLGHYHRAEELAHQMGMRPWLWQAQAAQAKTLAALGREEAAEAKRRAALAGIDEMAALFQDAELRVLFVESAMKKVV